MDDIKLRNAVKTIVHRLIADGTKYELGHVIRLLMFITGKPVPVDKVKKFAEDALKN